MSDEYARRRRAAEIAMRRRLGMRKDKAEQVKTHMLSQPDLHTTCRHCGQTVRGSLEAIQAHVGGCDGHRTGQ